MIQVRSVTYTLMIALIFTVVQNWALWRYLEPILHSGEWQAGLVFTLPLLIFALLVFFSVLLVWPYGHRILLPFFLLLSSIATYGMLAYGVFFNYTMMANVFETHYAESVDYVSWRSVLSVLGLFVPFWFFFTRCRVVFPRSMWGLFGEKLLLIGGAVLVVILIAAGYYKNYASLVRNHPEVRSLINPTNYLSASFRYLRTHWIEGRLPFEQIALDATDLDVDKRSPNVLVLVVGETARSMNYQLNGYDRATNPRLSQLPVFSFQDVSSCGTDTAVSVPCMFSNMTRSTYNAMRARKREGLLDVLKRAGISVVWLENNSDCKGVCQRVRYIDVRENTSSPFCKGKQCLDEALLALLQKELSNVMHNTVIVLHLLGSHGPAYYRRYSETSRHFQPACETHDLHQCTQAEVLNAYDNSIVYTDSVLAQAIDLLKTKEDRMTGALLYISDHGESLGESGLYLHGLPYRIAPKEQTQVPMIAWLSPQWLKRKNLAQGCLDQIANEQAVSHDHLFHTVLGMMSIKTQAHARELDVFLPCMKEKDDKS